MLETYSTFQFVLMCLSYLIWIAAGGCFILWLFWKMAEEGNCDVTDS